ncbi:peptide deformylase [Planctomycetaceae bacterium SH139]
MPLEIIPFPHPTLRYRSKPIRRVDSELKRIAAEMLDLMYEANGVGLAANQVDLPLRLFVINPAGKRGEGEEMVLLNPEIQRPKGSEAAEEGCLSLPGMYGTVMRPKEISLSAYDLSGNQIECRVGGFPARVLMHEYDHLDGVLFFDRMADTAREDLHTPLEEMELEFRSRQQTGAIPSDEALLARLATWEQRYA